MMEAKKMKLLMDCRRASSTQPVQTLRKTEKDEQAAN
jgi:hypothetical protein